MPIPRSFRALCLQVFVLVGWLSISPCAVSGRTEHPKPGSVYLVPERMRLEDGEMVSYDRGIIFVPSIRSQSESQLISVEFCRFKCEQGDDGLPPVFKLHGGPGFQGLKTPDLGYLESNVWPVTRELGADYVVVGQRGIGSSKPNTLLGPIGGFPADQKVTTDDFTEAIQRACTAGRTYWKSQGLELEGFNVIEAAADVNDVREALDYDSIIISGTSFGSHWGMAVMRYHPRVVARAVLSGIEGPNHTWDVPSHVLKALKRIAADAEKDREIVDRLSGKGLIETLDRVLRLLEKTPATVAIGNSAEQETRDVLLDARAMRGRVLSGMSSREGIQKWPARIVAWNEGDFEEAASAHYQNVAPLHGMTASFFLLDCASGVSRARRSMIDSDSASRIIGRVNQAYRAAETVWQVDLGDSFRRNFDSGIPTLMVHGTWDVNTPIENAKELIPHFKNGKLVSVERGSHAALREAKELSPSFRRELLGFLRTGDHSDVPARVVLSTLDWDEP